MKDEKRESYLGSKGGCGTWQIITASMPPHDTYIETHVGTGAVLRNKGASIRTIANDLNHETLQAYPLPDGVEVYNLDAIEFLAALDLDAMGRVLIYVDPPYLHSTRTSNKRYDFEYTDADHLALLSVLKGLSAKGHAVIISGYPSKLYDNELTGWRSLEFQAMTRGGVRTEKIWMNYKYDLKHWTKDVGDGWINRQRIRRKAVKWADKFAALPTEERQAVLSAIMAKAAIDGA